MPDQLSLDLGGPIDRMPAFGERLYFAAVPDPPKAEDIKQFADRFAAANALPGRVYDAERLHISLYGVGERRRLPRDLVHGARLAAEAISAEPFEIIFTSIMSFESLVRRNRTLPKHPLVLLTQHPALSSLNAQLGVQLARKKRLRAAIGIRPHMTLLRSETFVTPQEIEPIHLIVRDFVLVRTWRKESYYQLEGRWPLHV